MKKSPKSVIQDKQKIINKQLEIERLETEKINKQIEDDATMSQFNQLKQPLLDAVIESEADDHIRDNMTGVECMKVLKEVCDELSVLPRLQVLDAIQNDHELSQQIDELKKMAKIVFLTVPKDDHIRMAVVSLFKISLNIDLELPYQEDFRKKEVVEKIETKVVDPEREALLAKLTKK